MSTRRVLILAGPTASGKTPLAISLARRFDAEIVGADSRQIYRGMPIGTAAPTLDERADAVHHVVDFLEPRERYSAAQYVRDASNAIREIHARGKRVIVVGGTGFYIRALIGGVQLAPQYDANVRTRLAAEARVHPVEVLHAWLSTRNSVRAGAIDPNDRYRILRALEVTMAPCESREHSERSENEGAAEFAFAGIFLDVPWPELDQRILARTDAMLRAGLVEEAEAVGADAAAANSVGYPQALAYLRGWSSRAELAASLARATRRYARRQRSWFRNEPTFIWATRDGAFNLAKELLNET